MLDHQVQNTLIALDQSTMENAPTSAGRYHSTIDKENIERYESENQRLKRINEVLKREINKK
jgi:hypothetical protein